MAQIIERVQAHYETREVPFGKTYEWHQAYVALKCECGEQLILTATSTTTTTCHRCGANLGGFVHDIREGEEHLPDERTRPWFHDSKERAEQHNQDEGAYPVGSPWRYDDITGDP